MNRRIPTPVFATVVLILLVGLGSWAYFGDTYLKQSRRMKLGREYLAGISNRVYSFPEFRMVRVGVGTARTGCFVVAGTVDTHKEALKLQEVIA